MSAATARVATARVATARVQSTAVRSAPGARAGAPAPRQAPRRPPQVHLVPTGAPAPNGTAAFVASCAGLLAATLASLLALNVAVSGNAFTLAELSDDAARLQDVEQSLRLAVAEEAAPQRLDVRARELGMVPAEAPLVLRLPAPVAVGPTTGDAAIAGTEAGG